MWSQSARKLLIQDRHSFLLNAFEQVTIYVHRDGDAAMSKDVCYGLGVNSSGNHERRRRMSKAVEREMRQVSISHNAGKIFAYPLAADGRADLCGEDMSSTAP